MLKDIKTTALMVALALTLVRLHWVASQIRLVAEIDHSQWLAAAQIAGNSLFLIPFPALLWVLGITNTKPLISGWLRSLALTTACVDGLLLAVPQIYLLVRAVQRLPFLRQSSGETVARQTWGWIQNPRVGGIMWDGIALMSHVALILFLVALCRPGPSSENMTDGPSRQLAKRIAALATFAGAMSVLLSITYWGYSIFMTYARPDQGSWTGPVARNQFILRNWSFLLPILCWTVVAWIIFRGLVKPLKEPNGLR